MEKVSVIIDCLAFQAVYVTRNSKLFNGIKHLDITGVFMVIFMKTDRMLISKCTEKANGLKIKKRI